jgi:hypothetical protein
MSGSSPLNSESIWPVAMERSLRKNCSLGVGGEHACVNKAWGLCGVWRSAGESAMESPGQLNKCRAQGS